MIRATICIPKQRLQRMRGKAMTNTNDNPYAAPTLELAREVEHKHLDFEFTEKGIRFAKKLDLAKICLVTGRTDNLVPRRAPLLWMSLFARIVIFGVLPVLSLSGPLGLFLMNRYFSQNSNPVLQQLQNIKLLPLAWMALFQVAITSGIMLSRRGRLTTYIHSSIKRRIRTYKFDAFITGIFAATFSFGVVAFTISRESATEVAWLALLCATVLGLIGGIWRWVRLKKSRSIFHGLQLKVIDYRDGQFEVVGFTPEFLEAIGTGGIR